MIRNIVIDAVDAEGLADFWAEAAGFERGMASDNYLTLNSKEQRFPQILIQKVPESKARVKNRVHLDLIPTAGELEVEIRRLEGLGGRRVRYVENDPDESHWIMADPEGNEFCCVRPPWEPRPVRLEGAPAAQDDGDAPA